MKRKCDAPDTGEFILRLMGEIDEHRDSIPAASFGVHSVHRHALNGVKSQLILAHTAVLRADEMRRLEKAYRDAQDTAEADE